MAIRFDEASIRLERVGSSPDDTATYSITGPTLITDPKVIAAIDAFFESAGPAIPVEIKNGWSQQFVFTVTNTIVIPPITD